RPRRSTLFPYTTLFRSRLPQLSRVLNGALRRLDPLLLARLGGGRGEWHSTDATVEPTRYRTELGAALKYAIQAHDTLTRRTETRSEEHTSELQSRGHLV